MNKKKYLNCILSDTILKKKKKKRKKKEYTCDKHVYLIYMMEHAFGFSSLNIINHSSSLQQSNKIGGLESSFETPSLDSFDASSFLTIISTFFPVFFFNFFKTFCGSIRPVTTTPCFFMSVVNFSTPYKI